MKTITPDAAAALLRDGATLIDVREPDEHARERIPGARNLPLSRLEETALAVQQGKPVLFHCRSGARTADNADRLSAKAGLCQAFILEGGLDAWQRAGLPVAKDRSQPLPMMRQVQRPVAWWCWASCWAPWPRHGSSRCRALSARASFSRA